MPDSITTWIAVAVTAVVLIFAWLVYMGRGKRATRVTFSGFGVSLTIDSAEPQKHVAAKGRAIDSNGA